MKDKDLATITEAVAQSFAGLPDRGASPCVDAVPRQVATPVRGLDPVTKYRRHV
jgi:hypothetical protein